MLCLLPGLVVAMLTSGELRHAYRVAVNEWLDDNAVAGDDAHDAGLRAVEAAVRADTEQRVQADMRAEIVARADVLYFNGGYGTINRKMLERTVRESSVVPAIRDELSIPVTPGGES